MKFKTRQKLFISLLLALLLLCTSIVFIAAQTNYAYAAASTSAIVDSNLKFVLYTNTRTGNSEYKVIALNRNLTETEIPDKYNNIPVTEVADNAFSNCSQLTYVKIPNTIIRLGNNAFLNCTKLKRIVGMTNVKILGNNVFNNCTELEDLILPANLEYVGSSIIKNVSTDVYSRRSASEMTTMNANWDMGRSETSELIFGNKLVCDEVIENDILVGYEIRECQNLAPEEDFIVYSSWKNDENGEYLPILNIKKEAFNSNTFGSLTIKHDEALNFNHTINISGSAFLNVTARYISIDVDITLNDPSENDPTYLEEEKGTSVSVFDSTNVETIKLPKNINRVTRSMFAFSTVSKIEFLGDTLGSNYLPENIIAIDTSAFAGTWNLENLYIPSSVITMGDTVFSLWGDGGIKQIININLSEAPTSWLNTWNEGINYDVAEVKFESVKTTYTVTLDKQNGSENTDKVDVEYGKPMPTATAPVKEKFIFQGYYSGKHGSGTKYYNADMTSANNWDKKSTATLYAFWKGVESNITFDKQGGTGGTDVKNAEYNEILPSAIAPSRDNYIFKGYYSETDGRGTQYYDENMNGSIWDMTDNTTIYAYWKGIESTVVFDKQGGTGGTNIVMAEYGANMPNDLKAPDRINYIFQGYYEKPNGEGRQYYDADMKSINTWDKNTETTIYANWKGVPCVIIFDKQGGIGGTDSITVEYGGILPSFPLVTAPSKGDGISFQGYFLDKIFYYNHDMASGDRRWYISIPTTFQAKWENKKYTVALEPEGGEGGTPATTATFSDPMKKEIAPIREGYIFQGYFTERNGQGLQYYDSAMNSTRNWDIAHDATLFAYWTLKSYTVLLNQNGGINGTEKITVYYNEKMPSIAIPEKFGYVFEYYYDSYGGRYYENKHGQAVYIEYYYRYREDITLTACWEERTYDLKFSIEGVDGYPSYSFGTHKYTDIVILSAPTYNGYNFEKWGDGSTSVTKSISIQDVVMSWGTDMQTGSNGLAMTFKLFGSIKYNKNCVAEGTLITLYDGSMVPVEKLTGNELLLVWNLRTGEFDKAPILFIDHDARKNYEVINLHFSDGTVVKVISEHAFWDFNLNQYVFLRQDAAKYIGHLFNKQTTDSNGNMIWTKVTLTNVVVKQEYTSSWSPVTYGHLCYYVNGMLSMPGATTGLINIFEVNSDVMKYDEISYHSDIEKYGLFTYEEFAEICPVPREIFDAFNGKYLKVSIGKGLITWKQLEKLIQRYADFFV